jgi:very-short-patch-repair endonuclease
VGHPNIADEGRWMAAVLACGDGAVLSHRSAAELWGIQPRSRRLSGVGGPGDEASVDVTIPVESGRARRSGIRLHRSSTLSPADCTRRAGIPVTKSARTLEDLHRVVTGKAFAAALREAEFLRLPIGDAFKPDRTRSDLEAMFLSLVRRHRLPQPEVNVKIDRFLVDFLWRAGWLIVEVDGWEAHRTRSAFEDDRARDARLKVLGYDVLRFTWRHVEENSAAVARTIRQLLRR